MLYTYRAATPEESDRIFTVARAKNLQPSSRLEPTTPASQVPEATTTSGTGLVRSLKKMQNNRNEGSEKKLTSSEKKNSSPVKVKCTSMVMEAVEGDPQWSDLSKLKQTFRFLFGFFLRLKKTFASWWLELDPENNAAKFFPIGLCKWSTKGHSIEILQYSNDVISLHSEIGREWFGGR